jgi:hypothetical protein
VTDNEPTSPTVRDRLTAAGLSRERITDLDTRRVKIFPPT